MQANQQRYWEEIKASDVYKFFLGRKEPKRKKIVIRVNEGEKKFFKSSELIPDKDYVSVNFFRMLKRIEKELTFVDLKSSPNIKKDMNDTINQIPLYKAVFDKIKFFIREQDIKTNLVDIFVEDKGCVK